MYHYIYTPHIANIRNIVTCSLLFNHTLVRHLKRRKFIFVREGKTKTQKNTLCFWVAMLAQDTLSGITTAGSNPYTVIANSEIAE